MNNQPIGIFDSGMGGLTVVKEVIKLLPNEDIVYFGDTARVPYGPKSQDTIIRFSIENILFLLGHKVKIIIIACNTSSSVALHIAERNFKVPILGVIKPGAIEAVRVTKNKKIGIIGTRTTIKSGAYKKEIKKISEDIKVYGESCPLFVPLVEEGWLKEPVSEEIARCYLAPFRKLGVDTIVLGCTHYPLLKPLIKKVVGNGISLVDSAQQVARQAKEVLAQQGLTANRKTGRAKIKFFVSDEPENFSVQGRKFLGVNLNNVKKVSNV